ncbi:MAG: GntR family transcriptional regulator [Planctomycetes bacterium]|nr:GntR family transcriptional regulator [Planctomycetota bacterium]MBU4399849.1 GntR family transcriptional regulator [Planctomycetota bacterium]MCG2685177.1 GntR family transcriptional regulator [Planctomycetales bacterium]
MGAAPRHKIRRRRLSEELTAQLRKYIIDHDLKPGDPLLTEREMVERFGVSHTVVREATKALDFLGIIDATPRRGMVLDKFDFDRVSDYFGFHFALSDYPKDKLLKSRAVIEAGALPYTMEEMKRNPTLYPRLRDLAEAAPERGDAADQRWIEYDIAFHRGLVAASDLTPLASFCDLLQAFFHKFRPVMGSVRGDSETHCRIVEELRAGHLEAATELLRSHLSFYERGKQ